MGISTVQVSSPTHFVKVVDPNTVTQQFAINHEKFAHLATPAEFEQLKSHLIEIDIKTELGKIKSDGFLEISVPVLGLTDFLAATPTWHEFSQQFPVPIVVNRYGAPMDTEGEAQYYPQADFVVVKDILGNQFELFVNADGLIEIPEKGTGLFSVITEITYIFSHDQVIDGRGLYQFENVGAESGKLYLLPPPGVHDRFNVKISAAYLDETNQKVVDYVQKVPVVQLHDELSEAAAVNVAVKNLSDEQENLIQLEIAYRKKNYHGESFGLDISLEKAFGVTYGILDAHSGWSQQNESNILTKQVGLSDYALTALVRNVFSEYDFSKSLLAGESFEISQKSGFNDFVLSPEAIGLYYDLFVSGIVQQSLPGEWLFAHVPNDRIENLNLDYAFLNYHDSALISNIVDDVKAGHYESFANHFFDPSEPSEIWVHETLNVLTIGADPDFLPTVEGKFHVFQDHDFKNLIDSMPSLTDAALSHAAEALSHEVALSPGHEAMTIHYSDIVDTSSALGATITGFNIYHDKLNLGDFLDNNPNFSKDTIRADIQGQDVHVIVTNTMTGEELTVATLVGAHQSTQDPNLPPSPQFIEFDT
ncbi:MAG: hypothetical protein U1E78_03310 [Gammaproteobacteria bacterium]